MNTEERQYWINILPIMTPEQLMNLKDILTSEKEQLAAIDAKYATAAAPAVSIEDIASKIQQKKNERRKAELEADQHEKTKEQDILSQIESI